MPDQIIISQLAIPTRIGATEDERRYPQVLHVFLLVEPRRRFDELDDRLENTVDYAQLAEAVKRLAATGERVLVETLAVDIARFLLQQYPLAAVEVELRKFILPETEFVGVKIRREA